MSSRSMTVCVAIGVVLLFGLSVSTVRADSVDAKEFLKQVNWGHQKQLLYISNWEEFRYLDHLESNNGKHLGWFGAHSNNGKHLGWFGMTVVRVGPVLGVAGSSGAGNGNPTTPNPEPATMVLFGTGLIAVGYYARRRYRS